MRVLCYHSFREFPESSPAFEYGIAPATLDRQLTSFRRWGYRFLTPDELHAGLAGKRPLGRRDLAVTIDDGYVDNLEAREVLARHEVRPLLFVVAGALGGTSHWMNPADLPLLSAQQLLALKAEGWEIGSHSMSHPFLTRTDDRGLEVELADSRSELDQTGLGPIRALAYPHGLHDARVRAAAESAGYEFGYALEFDEVDGGGDPFHVSRLEVLRSHSLPRLRLLLALPGAWARRVLKAEDLCERAARRLRRSITG